MIDDPLGLAEARITLERTDTLLVYPRVYQLDGLFTDAGTVGGDEGRALLHRTAGYDLHSIRDFQQGESLRRVHWRSTAKRRKLMVKELTELPRDESAVLLDCDRSCQRAGAPGSSSFDAQVRAAASLLNAMVEGGQRCSLVLHGLTRRRIRVQAGGGEWGTALAALAAVRADADRPLTAMVREALGATGAAEAVDAARVYVVTAALTPELATRLLALRSARRDVAVVWVDAPSFAGVERVPGRGRRGLAAAGSLGRVGGAAGRRRRRRPGAFVGDREEGRPWLSGCGCWRRWPCSAAGTGRGWSGRELAASELALLTLLATAPALLAALGRLRQAVAVTVVSALGAVWLAFGYLPFERGHPLYPVRIGHAIHDGAKSWFDTVTPFDPGPLPAHRRPRRSCASSG